MASKNLSPNNIALLNELINVKRISDLEEVPHGIDDSSVIDQTMLYNSYVLTSTYLDSSSRYANYKLKMSELTDYLQELGSARLDEFQNKFNEFIQNLIDNTTTDSSFIRFEAKDNVTANSYTINPIYSEIQTGEFGFAYSDDGTSSYAYTDILKSGIVTADVLEEYVRNTVGRILGVPNTPAAVSEAMDSVIEFVDWFKGYVRGDTSYGSLGQLISTIESKDAEVKDLSYAYTVENRELAYSYVESSYNNLYNGISTQLENLEILSAGTNISIDTDKKINCDIDIDTTGNKSFIINGKKYALSMTDGKLKIGEFEDPYVLFEVSFSGISSSEYEIDENSGGSNIEITLTPTSKNCTVTDKSSNWFSNLPNELTKNQQYTCTVSYLKNTPTTFEITLTEIDDSVGNSNEFGHTELATWTKTITKKYNKRGVWIFTSTNDITTDIFSLNNSRDLTSTGTTISVKKKLTWTAASKINTSINIGAGNEYVFVLIPSDWINSTYKFYWNSDFGETPNLKCSTVALYTTNETYYLYRSVERQTGNSFTVEYTKK